jgi:hypothetical protein
MTPVGLARGDPSPPSSFLFFTFRRTLKEQRNSEAAKTREEHQACATSVRARLGFFIVHPSAPEIKGKIHTDQEYFRMTNEGGAR